MKLLIPYLLLLLHSPISASAEEARRDLNVFDHFQKRISQKWKGMNQSVDAFFAGENYEEELNQSYIRFNFIYKRAKGQNEGAEYNFRFQTDFPNTTKELKLIIQKESDERGGDDSGNFESDLAEVANNVGVSEAFNDNRYSAAGRGHFFKDRGWKSHADLGMRFDVPFDPFVKLRARKRFLFKKDYLDVVQKLSYYRIDELGHQTDFDYHLPISKFYRLQFLNIFSYRRADRFYRFSNSLTFMHSYSDKTSLAYSTAAAGESEPVYAYNNYSTSATMRTLLHGKWLYGQLVVGVNFPREHDFEARSFSLWELEAYF